MATKTLNIEDDSDDWEVKTIPFTWPKISGDRQWHLLTTYNAFAFASLAASNEDDGAEQSKAFFHIIVTLVVPDEREAWTNAIVDAGVPMTVLVEKMKKLLEAAGKDDSPSPATSSGTAAPKTSKPRSTAGSSSARGSASRT